MSTATYPTKPCQCTREHFKAAAEPLALTIDGKVLTLDPKEFTTGSFGWSTNGKVIIRVGGIDLTAQLCFNLPVVNSKSATA